jgi:hypothetical protein
VDAECIEGTWFVEDRATGHMGQGPTFEDAYWASKKVMSGPVAIAPAHSEIRIKVPDEKAG